MIDKAFETRFKRLVLKSLIRGGITEETAAQFIDVLNTQSEYIVRDATDKERIELKEKINGGGNAEKEPKRAKNGSGVVMNRAIFKKALKGKFNAYKEYFYKLFDCGKFEVVVF